MNFQSHSRRNPVDALIRYNNIVNKAALNNVLASRHKQRQNCPVSDLTDAYKVLVHVKHS